MCTLYIEHREKNRMRSLFIELRMRYLYTDHRMCSLDMEHIMCTALGLSSAEHVRTTSSAARRASSVSFVGGGVSCAS